MFGFPVTCQDEARLPARTAGRLARRREFVDALAHGGVLVVPVIGVQVVYSTARRPS